MSAALRSRSWRSTSSAGRAAFAAGVAALLIYGGWGSWGKSRDGIRTRSYFESTPSHTSDPPVRQLTHGTTPAMASRASRPSRDGGRTHITPPSRRRPCLGRGFALQGEEAAIGIVGLRYRHALLLPNRARNGGSSRSIRQWWNREDPRRASPSFSRCAPQAKIVLGDARLSLARDPPGASTFSPSRLFLRTLSDPSSHARRSSLRPGVEAGRPAPPPHLEPLSRSGAGAGGG